MVLWLIKKCKVTKRELELLTKLNNDAVVAEPLELKPSLFYRSEHNFYNLPSKTSRKMKSTCSNGTPSTLLCVIEAIQHSFSDEAKAAVSYITEADEQHVWWHACIRVCTVLCYSIEKSFYIQRKVLSTDSRSPVHST